MSDNHLVENIAYQCVTKHIHMGMGDQTAIRWLATSREQQEISYLELEILSNQIANLLRSQDRSGGLCQRFPSITRIDHIVPGDFQGPSNILCIIFNFWGKCITGSIAG